VTHQENVQRKETDQMKKTEKKSLNGKIAGLLVLALIVGGMTLLPAVSNLDPGSGMMATLFIAFLGAIIAIQVIPGLMLFGMMLKGIASLFRKAEVTKETE
jgi:hypothetical protein